MPAELAKASGATPVKLMAAATVLVPGEALADALASARRGTLDGVPEGEAPLESVGEREGVVEAAAVPDSDEEGDVEGVPVED